MPLNANSASAPVPCWTGTGTPHPSQPSSWTRGSNVAPSWGRRAITGETVKPRQFWTGPNGGLLPVFLDRSGKRLDIGRSRRTVSQVLGWLRAGKDHLALVTNGRQWRLLFAGLDFDAWCEWDLELWFEHGEISPQVTALRTLLSPMLWTPESEDVEAPLLQAIRDTRKGQAELSEVLGERVREAAELLIQGHGEALKERCGDVDPADIYRAACRVAMRLVVILFAKSRAQVTKRQKGTVTFLCCQDHVPDRRYTTRHGRPASFRAAVPWSLVHSLKPEHVAACRHHRSRVTLCQQVHQRHAAKGLDRPADHGWDSIPFEIVHEEVGRCCQGRDCSGALRGHAVLQPFVDCLAAHTEVTSRLGSAQVPYL